MNIKSALFLSAILILTACKNNNVELTGILEYPLPGQYIFLQELKSDALLNVDSVIVSNDGKFEFKRKVKFPSFYLLKINQNNFLTMLVEPGEKIKMTSHFDSLNYPVVVSGSKGTGLIADYNKKLLSTRNKIRGLNDLFNNNTR